MEDGRPYVLDRESPSPNFLQYVDPFKAKKELETTQTEKHKAAAVPDRFIEDEHRASGGVQASVYWEYIKAGGLLWWSILLPIFAVYRVIAVGQAWFLKTWGEAYNTKSSSHAFMQSPEFMYTKPTFLDNLPPPDVNIKPWLLGFFLLALGQSVTFAFSQGTMIIIIYTAGKNMFAAIMAKVAGASFRFYDCHTYRPTHEPHDFRHRGHRRQHIYALPTGDFASYLMDFCIDCHCVCNTHISGVLSTLDNRLRGDLPALHTHFAEPAASGDGFSHTADVQLRSLAERPDHGPRLLRTAAISG